MSIADSTLADEHYESFLKELSTLVFPDNADLECFVFVPGSSSGIEIEPRFCGVPLIDKVYGLAGLNLDFPTLRRFISHLINVSTALRTDAPIYTLAGTPLTPLGRRTLENGITQGFSELGTTVLRAPTGTFVRDYMFEPDPFFGRLLHFRRDTLSRCKTGEAHTLLDTAAFNLQGFPARGVPTPDGSKPSIYFHPLSEGFVRFYGSNGKMEIRYGDPRDASPKLGVFARLRGTPKTD